MRAVAKIKVFGKRVSKTCDLDYLGKNVVSASNPHFEKNPGMLCQGNTFNCHLQVKRHGTITYIVY